MKEEPWNIPFEKWKPYQNPHEWAFSERDPRYYIDKQLLYDALYETLNTLNEREAEILILYDIKNETFRSIGKIYKITQGRVRQVYLKALRKMRHPKRSNKLIKMMANLTEGEWNAKQKKEEEEERARRKEEYKKAREEHKRHLEEAQKRREELARLRHIKHEEEMRKWKEERKRVQDYCDRGYAEKPPHFLELGYDSNTRLHFIKCPEWTTFNVPMDVYKRWLKYLMDDENKVQKKGCKK